MGDIEDSLQRAITAHRAVLASARDIGAQLELEQAQADLATAALIEAQQPTTTTNS